MERENARCRGGSETPQALWDDLLADEIFSRLPTKCAARCGALSRGIRRLLTAPEFWLSRGGLGGAPHPFQGAACFIGFMENSRGRGASRRRPRALRRQHALHVVDGGALSIKNGVGLPFLGRYRHGGTCNGLVLLTAVTNSWSWQPVSNRLFDAVIVNPATREEEAVRVSLPATVPADTPWPWRPLHLCGFGYSPASKAYKALIVERDNVPAYHSVVRFMVASFGGGGQEPVATSVKLIKFSGYNMDLRCEGSLAMDGGMVYVLTSTASVPVVLSFSVDNEVVTTIDLPPEGEGRVLSGLMQVWGRPCIAIAIDMYYDDDDDDIFTFMDGSSHTVALWTLTADHRWERRCMLIYHPNPYYHSIFCDGSVDTLIDGVWDCGGVLFVLFGGRHRKMMINLYDLRVAPREEDSGTHRPVKTFSPDTQVAKEKRWCQDSLDILWGYHPTLVSPASVFGCGGSCESLHFRSFQSDDPRQPECAGVLGREYLEVFVEMMQKLPDSMEDVKQELFISSR